MNNIWITIIFIIASFNPFFTQSQYRTPSSTATQVHASSHVDAPKTTPTPAPVNTPASTPVTPQPSTPVTSVNVVPVKSAPVTPPTPSHDTYPVNPTCNNVPTGANASGACASNDKCSSNCTDPNRPSYDLWGNKFDATGHLLWAACPNKPDPISGKDNPYCVCPAATSQGVYFVRGNDMNTNQVVCGFGYYHECPYAEAVSADDPLCQKLGAEQGK